MTHTRLVSALRKAGHNPHLGAARPSDIPGTFGAWVRSGHLIMGWTYRQNRVASLTVRDDEHVCGPYEDYCNFVWFPKTIKEAVKKMGQAL